MVEVGVRTSHFIVTRHEMVQGLSGRYGAPIGSEHVIL